MESFDRHKPRSATYLSEGSGELEHRSHSSRRSHRKEKTPLSHKICDGITEGLIYWMVIFTPWAFGTTQHWSIWTANISAYLIGSLLIAKWFIRWRTGYRPDRWDTTSLGDDTLTIRTTSKLQKYLTFSLAGLTILILTYCAISALNPRAIYLPRQNRFEYQDYTHWLPHSYDPARTWFVFWQYLGLAWFFWATRDWLITKISGHTPGHRSSILPVRLERLLWVLSINGAILALEAILQRLDGTNKLLWLIVPRINNIAEAQFGPYAYRSNAATYFNLAWPTCLSLWLTLRGRGARKGMMEQRLGGGSRAVLLPCTVLMAAAPIISTARGGALIAFVNILIAAALVFWQGRRERSLARIGYLSFFLVVLGFAGYLGWAKLAERFKTVFTDRLSMRTVIYDNANQIVRDFPVFGTGPGTFGRIYQLYRNSSDVAEAYTHNDWLETRVTFGWVGFGIVLLLLLTMASIWIYNRFQNPSFDPIHMMLGLAIAGCLVHARFDFPFQVYSLFFLFVLLCTIPICLTSSSNR